MKRQFDIAFWTGSKYEKRTVECKQTGDPNKWVGRCPLGTHEDKDPSFYVYLDDRHWHCFGCLETGHLWDENLASNKTGKSYKQTNKKYLQEAENKGVKGDILRAIDTDIRNWEGYSKEIREERRRRIPNDLCYLPEDEVNLVMGAIVKAGIFRRTELRDAIKPMKNFLKKVEGTKKEPQTKVKFNPKPYAEMIFKDFHFKADEFDRFYIYDSRNGVYRERAEIYIQHYLRKKYLSEEDYSRHKVSEVVAHIRDLSFVDIEDIEKMIPPLNLVPFANCIYDIDADKTIKYSPDYFFTTKLKVKWNPKCGGCPTIDKIFHEIVNEEDVISLYELASYTFYRAYPYPKIFFLYGSGGNGKSVYSNILTRLIGSRNIATENSYSLQNNRFSGGNLLDKSINIATEMEYSILRNTTMLKQLTGEDLIRSERKYGRVFNFYNYAKVIFLGNAIPETIDTTFGWYRRVFLLEFPNKFIVGQNANPNLVRNLSEEEIEGLALWAVIRYKESVNKGFVFTNHKETEKVKEEYEALSNPLSKFLKDHTKKDYRIEIFCDDFYDRFSEFLRNKEMRGMEPNAVGRRMTQLGYKKKEVTREDRRASAYLGITWKP